MAVDPARSFERRGALRRVEPSVLVPQVAARAEQKGQVDEDLADVLTGAGQLLLHRRESPDDDVQSRFVAPVLACHQPLRGLDRLRSPSPWPVRHRLPLLGPAHSATLTVHTARSRRSAEYAEEGPWRVGPGSGSRRR